MSGRYEIIFCGVGGQGLLLDASVMGNAATIQEKRQAVMSCAYGTETRGTFTKAELIISDDYIDFPEALEADVVVALAQVAYDRYVDTMKENSIILYDSVNVQEKDSKARQYALPLTDIAVNNGNKGSLNVAAMGALIGITGCLSPDAAKVALAERFRGKEKVIAINEAIFNAGFAAGRKLLEH